MIEHLLRQIINRTSFLHLATGNSLAIMVEVPRYLNDLQQDQPLLLLQTNDGKNEVSKAEKDFAQFIDQTARPGKAKAIQQLNNIHPKLPSQRLFPLNLSL
jgi:hypothetical protein